MQIVEIIITCLLILTIMLLLFRNMSLYFQNNELNKKVLQSQIDRLIFIDKLKKDLEQEDSQIEDGFIKFITESREQAFKYIEDSQEIIKEFLSYVDKNIDHLKNGQAKDLKYKVIIKDLEEYAKKLKQLLPKEL